MALTSREGSWALNEPQIDIERVVTQCEREKEEIQLPGYDESQEAPYDESQNSNNISVDHCDPHNDGEKKTSLTPTCPLPQGQKHTCQCLPSQSSRPDSCATICQWEGLQHVRHSSSDTSSSNSRIRSTPSYQSLESCRCSNLRHSASTNNFGRSIRRVSNSIAHYDLQNIPEPSGLAELRLPNGSLLSNRSHYPSEATIGTDEQSLTRSGTFDAVGNPPVNNLDVEAGHRYSDRKIAIEDKAQTQANKSHWVDSYREKFRDGFYRYGPRIQIYSLVLGLVVFFITLALLVVAGRCHSEKLAKGSFTGCVLIITACCGAFAAAIERSFGEVIIMMTMVVVIGILVAQQLDVWMSTNS